MSDSETSSASKVGAPGTAETTAAAEASPAGTSAPLNLGGSAPSWSMSYAPLDEAPEARAAEANALPHPPSARPNSPRRLLGEGDRTTGDASEGLAFALWNKGRKQEAIEVLERQIALQKDVGRASPEVQRSRFPLRVAIAAVLLLSVGGALWGGLNPAAENMSGPATDTELTADATAEIGETGALAMVSDSSSEADKASAPAIRLVSAETVPVVPPVASAPIVVDPAGDSGAAPVADTGADDLNEAPPAEGLASLAPDTPPELEMTESGEPAEGMPPSLGPAEQGLEARLPKPRPDYAPPPKAVVSAAPQVVAPAAPAPAPDYVDPGEAEQWQDDEWRDWDEEPDDYAGPPPPVPWSPAPQWYAGSGYPPPGAFPPGLMQRRMLAERYIARRRALAERRPMIVQPPIYYDVRPIPY
jgi:hypothetical protein